MITGGQEAAATHWEPITPNSWELSLIYDAVSRRKERVSGVVRSAGAQVGSSGAAAGPRLGVGASPRVAGRAGSLIQYALGTAGSRTNQPSCPRHPALPRGLIGQAGREGSGSQPRQGRDDSLAL